VCMSAPSLRRYTIALRIIALALDTSTRNNNVKNFLSKFSF